MFAIIRAEKNRYITTVYIRLTGIFRGEDREHKFWRDIPTVDAERLVEMTRSKLEKLDYHNRVLYLFQWERMTHLCDMCEKISVPLKK